MGPLAAAVVSVGCAFGAMPASSLAVAPNPVFTTGGFENYALTVLEGQEQWDVDGDANSGNTATVQNTVGNPGKSVRIDRSNGAVDNDKYWFRTIGIDGVTSGPAGDVIHVDFDLRFSPLASTKAYGHFAGVNAFGSTATSTVLQEIGGAGVDVFNGEVLILEERGTGLVGSGVLLAPNTWYHFTLAYNFADQKMWAYVNNNLINAYDFLNTVADFSDAPIASLGDITADAGPTGTGFIDNYTITRGDNVPEPSAAALLAIAGLLLGARNRRGGRRRAARAA